MRDRQIYIILNDLFDFYYSKNIVYKININDIKKMEIESNNIKTLIINSKFCNEDINLISRNYFELSKLYNQSDLEVAVRSSAIAEDLQNASFAGQQDTFLNIKGIHNLLISIKIDIYKPNFLFAILNSH